MAASLPRLRHLLILILATIGILIGLAVSAGHPAPLTIKLLRGTTGQKTTFYLAVRGNRAVAVKTSLGAKCGDGSTWAAKWSPSEGQLVHFAANGNSFSTSESIKLTYAHGVTGSAQFQLEGQLTGLAQAQGTVRLQASFYTDHQWAVAWGSRTPRRSGGMGAVAADPSTWPERLTTARSDVLEAEASLHA